MRDLHWMLIQQASPCSAGGWQWPCMQSWWCGHGLYWEHWAQRPRVQLAELQSPPSSQGWPASSSGPHTPPEQRWPLAHWALLRQATGLTLLQEPCRQLYPAGHGRWLSHRRGRTGRALMTPQTPPWGRRHGEPS